VADAEESLKMTIRATDDEFVSMTIMCERTEIVPNPPYNTSPLQSWEQSIDYRAGGALQLIRETSKYRTGDVITTSLTRFS